MFCIRILISKIYVLGILNDEKTLSHNNFKEILTKNEELAKRAFEALRKKEDNFDYLSEYDLYKDLLKKSIYTKRAFEALGKRNNYFSFTSETLDKKTKKSKEQAYNNKLDLYEKYLEHFSNKRAFEALGKRNNIKPLDDALFNISEGTKQNVNNLSKENIETIISDPSKRAFEALGRK